MKYFLAISFFLSGASAADVVVTKSQFIESMKTALPDVFCAENKYFRKCFKVTEDECLKEAMRAIKVCLMSLESELPEQLIEFQKVAVGFARILSRI